MTADILIQRATRGDSPEVAVMVGELLGGIMDTIGAQAFSFNPDDTMLRLQGLLCRGRYTGDPKLKVSLS